MLSMTKSIFYTATCKIPIENDEENPVSIANMEASINGDGVVYINKTIHSKNDFIKYKEIIQKDFSDFDSFVYEYLEAEISEDQTTHQELEAQ